MVANRVIESARELYSVNLQLLTQQNVLYVPSGDIHKSGITEDEACFLAMEIAFFTTKALLGVNSNKGYPNGHWYMITITQKDTETKDDILARHDKVMDYFRYRNIEVYHAALEKSNIFHIHYVCKFREFKKNEQRDLTAITNRRVQIEKKVNSLKSWQGLCKYVTKRDYNAEKSDTQVEALVSRIIYEEGKGYTLTD